MIDLTECTEWLTNKPFKRLCLQISDDLMIYSVEIVSHIQKFTNASIYITSDTGYESCCSDKINSDHVKADACIHFGHACLSCSDDLPTFYTFTKEMMDVSEFCEAFYKQFQDYTARILLFYDTSYAHWIENIYTTLSNDYSHLIVTKLDCFSNVKFTNATRNYNTKVLGRCYDLPENVLSVTYDAVFLGPNNKLLMALAMSIPLNTWYYFHNSEFHYYSIHESTRLKKRNFLIEKIKDAQIFGIIIASLSVGNYLEITEMLKSILTMVNKKIYVLSMGKISPTKLANFQEIDIFVLVSCPESTLLDMHDYFKPVVMPYEIELAFNSARNFSLYHPVDFRDILPGGVNHKKFELSVESDVSLICGKMRSIQTSNIAEEQTALIPKRLGTLVSDQIGTTVFQSRTWSGLEQKLGENQVELAVHGRAGIPINYANETSPY